MRALRLTAAFLAILASPQLAPPAGAASSSGFNVSCGSAAAGRDVTCSVTRLSGGKGIYVLFQTSDGTAHAGTDYTTVSQMLYFRAGSIVQSVAVHTAVNPTATGTLTFGVGVAVGSVAVRTTGSIVEPAVVPPATQTCPDGSVILATAVCPAPVPVPATPTWVLAPKVDGGYARCKTVGGCHSTSAPCPYTTGLNPPAVCTVPNIIAQQGDVRAYAWGGCDAANPCRREAALWPVGHYPKTSGVASDWYLGVAGWEDEWEGVAPAP